LFSPIAAAFDRRKIRKKLHESQWQWSGLARAEQIARPSHIEIGLGNVRASSAPRQHLGSSP
jgi:hypothetical protein